jgi:hypothetical protein
MPKATIGTKRDKDATTPARKKQGGEMETELPPEKKKNRVGRSKSRDPTSKSKSTGGRSVSKGGRSVSRPRSASKTPASRAKKTPSASSSFADKLKTPPSPKKPIKRLKHMKFVEGLLTMSRTPELRRDAYRKLGVTLSTLQAVQGGKSTRILNYRDIEDKPLLTATQMPSLHTEVCKYFHFDLITRLWSGETIPNGKTRRIPFSCYLESDVPIEELVEAVQIDLIDAQVQLQVKTCQAIRHEDKMHLMYVSNKFNRKQVEVDLQAQLTQLQKDYYIQDKESYLGKMEAAGKKFPKINLKLDYPFNGPFERRDGQDTWYKRVFVVEYAFDDKLHVKMAVQLYKKSGRLSQHWGEHPNIQIAPSKDPDITATTAVEKWHSICDSHSATMLSTGIVRLDGIKNPDVKVPIEYWKRSSRARADELTLHEVLHAPSKFREHRRTSKYFMGCVSLLMEGTRPPSQTRILLQKLKQGMLQPIQRDGFLVMSQARGGRRRASLL